MYDILRHTFPPPPRFKSPSAPWPDPACASQRPQNSTGDFAQVLCDPGRLTPPMGVKTSVYTPYCLVSYPMRIMPWVSLTLSKKCQALSEKAIQTRRKNRGLLCARRHQFLQHAVESLPITIIRYCRNSRLHAHCFTCERSFFLWRPMFAEEPPCVAAVRVSALSWGQHPSKSGFQRHERTRTE